MDGDEVSMETKLTKGDSVPRPVPVKYNKEILDMIGSTRESKARRYAAEEVRIVVKSYVGTIKNLNDKIEKKHQTSLISNLN